MKKFYSMLATAVAMLISTATVAADIPTGFVRISNRRNTAAYLTATGSSVAGATSLTDAEQAFRQVWYVSNSGRTYTLRNADTGQYLQSAYTTTAATASFFYIQESTNASGFYNISTASDFSGQTCLNLGNNGTALYSWSYAGDQGSDWTITPASDYDIDIVREHLTAAKGYVGTITDGGYYRLVSKLYDRVATEAGGQVKTEAADDTNFRQYWRLTKAPTGNGYYIQNVVTEQYIQPQGSTSAIYVTAATPAALYPVLKTSDWDYIWTIANGANDQYGLHTASSQSYNVVRWTISADASTWAIQKAHITDEQIAEARAEYAVYQDIVNNRDAYQQHLNALFATPLCDTLRPEIQALTTDELAANDDYAALNDTMKELVLKVKNNTWKTYTDTSTGYTAEYEHFFRVAPYRSYSNHQKMAASDATYMSNAFGKLSGPTGIVANPGDVIYVYVEDAPRAGSTLQLEAVTTEGVPGDHRTGITTNLRQGLNVYMPAQQEMLYIFYEINDIKSLLASYPDIRIHIEGGALNGYWDATRGMTNADWALLRQQLLNESPTLNLKTDRLVFAMNADIVKQTEPTEMEGLMRIWNNIPAYEESFMGLEEFEGRFRNIWNCFSINYQYMFATTYGTYYNETTLPTIMSYDKMTHQGNGNEGGAIWGPSHEMGHNHQATINVVGTTESSNNTWSNINLFEQGISTTRGSSIADNFAQLALGKTWNERDIWITTRMFFQLYLYFHVQHHDDEFFPKLFRAMRKTPINKGTWNASATYTDADGNRQTGAYETNGLNDYLRLARTICDVAQADLSEFFEAYGMFVPVQRYHVSDYSNYLVTTSATSITAAKRAMQRYPRKLGNIMFIDDRIERKKATPNPLFEGVPAANGYKVNCNNSTGYSVGTAGDVGDFEAYDGRTTNDATKDYFTISGSTITFHGSGYIGHKFYDLKGNLIWATNANKATLPANLRTLGPTAYTCVAAQVNMNDVPCPYYNASTSRIYSANVYFGTPDDTSDWYFNATTNLDAYMTDNTVAVAAANNRNGVPEEVLSTPNFVDMEGGAQAININGDLPWYLPASVTAQALSFTKAGTGYQLLTLPFAVTDADIESLQSADYDEASGAIKLFAVSSLQPGQPVAVQGKVNIAKTGVSVEAGSYQAQSSINVISADGTSYSLAETATPFTLPVERATAVRAISADGVGTAAMAPVFDISGRRITQPVHRGIYISRGHKYVVR